MRSYKRILWCLLLVAALLRGGHLQAADQRVLLSITLTNLPVTSNTLVFTAPAAKTITWTNVAGSANVVTGATIAASATNLYLQLAAYGVGVPRLSLGILTNATNFTLYGEVNQNIAVSATGTAGGNWCSLTLSTQTVTRLTTVRVPISSEVGDTNRTNVASLLVGGISDFSTNAISSNSIALTHALQLNTNTQTALGVKKFNQLSDSTNIGTVYGGKYSGMTNINPTTTNLINYGNALRSEGVGGNSLQVGSNAQAKALRTIAIGADAFSTNSDAVAIGTSATATNTEALAVGAGSLAAANSAIAVGNSTVSAESGIAIGNSAIVSGLYGVAMGFEANADGGRGTAFGGAARAGGTNSVSIGGDSSAMAPDSVSLGAQATVDSTHTNSVALGKGAATTQEGQIMLGSSDVFLVSTYGRIAPGSITNGLWTGTNRVDGDLSFTRYDASALAAGNNVAQPFTNVNVEVTGPSGNFAVCGIIGGRNGRFLKLQNNTAYVMTIAHESGVDSTAANRIRTPIYADVTVQSNGWALLSYDATISRWELESSYPSAAVSTNNLAAGATRQVIYNSGGIEDGAGGVLIDNETNVTVTGTFTNIAGVRLAGPGALIVGAGGGSITNILTGSASLDFGAIAAQAYEDKTITVTGAADGDVVQLGLPNAVMGQTLATAWVSGANTVTVRLYNTDIGIATGDFAAATFRVIVTKF